MNNKVCFLLMLIAPSTHLIFATKSKQQNKRKAEVVHIRPVASSDDEPLDLDTEIMQSGDASAIQNQIAKRQKTSEELHIALQCAHDPDEKRGLKEQCLQAQRSIQRLQTEIGMIHDQASKKTQSHAEDKPHKNSNNHAPY